MSITAWVMYEIISTMGDSIDLFWMHNRWSVFKILFFVNRISVVLTVIDVTIVNFAPFESSYDCIVATWVQFVLSVFIITIVAFTLASRIFALWRGNYIVLGILFLVMTANILNYLFIYGGALYRAPVKLGQAPFTGCCLVAQSNVMWVVFANTLSFEALSIGLIIYKAWPIARQRGIQTPLFTLLLEDGIGYYLSFTVSKLFIVGAIYFPTPISNVILPSYFSVPIASMAVNRLFIRLQRVMVQGPTFTEYTTANIATFHITSNESRSGSSGGGSVPKEVITIGGTGRVRARRHHDDVFSEGDIELATAEDLHDAYPHRDSTLAHTATAESVAHTTESKARSLV